MFGALTERLKGVFSSLTGEKKLTDDNLTEVVREVRLALLDADVNYSVVSSFVKKVKERAIGEKITSSLKPRDVFVKIVHDEILKLLGEEEPKIETKGHPTVIVLCGLQGSGKTTNAVKMATYLKKQNIKQKPLIAACDLQRPAAVEQLKQLGAKADIEVFTIPEDKSPVNVAKKALEKAKKDFYDLLIVDTAGRLQLDTELMAELKRVVDAVEPQEILFVANAATGQEAVKVAAEFDLKISITGTILTMLDGTSKAGAALSIKEITKKPLKFEGVGERVDDFRIFNPKSMVDRIFGMGDMINLVRKVEEVVSEKEARELEQKLKQNKFTFENFLEQLKKIKRLGPLKGLLKMLPGVPSDLDFDMFGDILFKSEAIILSMTKKEREGVDELSPSRRRRIAKGSGTQIEDVNRMIKNFNNMAKNYKMMKKLSKDFNL